MLYRTKDNDRIDTICYEHYGHLNGTVEAVYNANPTLANQPAKLPAGTVIELPEVQTQAQQKTIKLWD
ncbi:tail protein X [Pseudoalteromonas sp. MMG012]|uniref:tail protein X n=1 Tax=Pseudoalteromonas sp. MMG012 TaxID=2822686 RepID=UPI001B3A2D2D|nr:tail protein X [Pseudoalteromonas sp. MMG012]MBQ4852686.1 tail protein X [Pseudoalteromonas sp. MMG012]